VDILKAARRAAVAHLQTWRLYTLWYPGLVGLAGAALATRSPSTGQCAVAWAAPTLGWVAAHYLGDYFDRHLDAISKPQRPLPSGRLSPRTAVAAGSACAAATIVLCLLVNWRALAVTAAALAGIVAYSRVFKARGLSGNVVRGALTALALVFGVMAVQPWPPWQVVPFALVFCAHDAASNLVGTLRDVDGDREGGYRTLPVARGVRTAAWTAASLYLAAITVAAVSGLLLHAGRGGYFLLLAIAAAGGVGAFVLLLRGSDTPTATVSLRAHEVLVAERLVLASAVVAGGRGLVTAVVVLGPALVVSVLAQSWLRARHEFPSSVPSRSPAVSRTSG
jgi:geranylgeranylglycerol-phosphate geranylgeranyltransferase